MSGTRLYQVGGRKTLKNKEQFCGKDYEDPMRSGLSFDPNG